MKMASENESIESIVAKMRGPNSKTIRRMSQRLRNGEWRDDFRAALKDYADRIKAAWKRERNALMSQPRTWEECVQRSKEAWDDVY